MNNSNNNTSPITGEQLGACLSERVRCDHEIIAAIVDGDSDRENGEFFDWWEELQWDLETIDAGDLKAVSTFLVEWFPAEVEGLTPAQLEVCAQSFATGLEAWLVGRIGLFKPDGSGYRRATLDDLEATTAPTSTTNNEVAP